MPHTKKAFDWMDDNIDIFKKLEPKSFLYVGHRRTKDWWYNTYCDALGIERKAVVEIFEDNCIIAEMDLIKHGVEVIRGDVRFMHEFAKEGEWDIVFWDHGPEHCDEEDLDPATDVMKKHVDKALIYCCPWGDWPQGVLYDNEWEQHRTSVMPEMFERKGLAVVSLGKEGKHGSSNEAGELIGYWVKEEDDGQAHCNIT